MKTLARVTVAEAAERIRAAIAEAPLPDPLWLVPWIEYWKTHPTDTPTPSPDSEQPTPAAADEQPPASPAAGEAGSSPAVSPTAGVEG